MCRHLVYLGPPVTLSALLLDPPHSLLRQSWAPRDMRGGGTINADGFGAGWYIGDRSDTGDTGENRDRSDLIDLSGDSGGGAGYRSDKGDKGDKGAAPVRYRRNCPMWADESFARLAEITTSGAVLASVRSATVGMSLVEAACAPFTEDRWLFSLNGLVAGWPDSITTLAERLPVRDLLTLDAPTDAAVVWALVRHRLRDGVHPAEAVAHTVADVAAAAPSSRLNLLLTDGVVAVASTMGHSLSLRRDAGAVLLASEPCDPDPRWQALPDGALVTATKAAVEVSDLQIEAGRQ